jgi:hypothetical protein
LPIKQRLQISSLNSFINTNSNPDFIIKTGLEQIHERITQIEAKIINEDKVYFTPSKTAQNGINFITKDHIEDILKNSHDETLVDIFKLFYILNGEEYTKPEIIENLFIDLGNKGMSLSKDFLF